MVNPISSIASGAKGSFQFIKSNKYSVYVLVIIMLAFMGNQLHTFSLVATNSKMAQEIKYGDRECAPLSSLKNETAVKIILRQKGYNGTVKQFCKANSVQCDRSKVPTNETLCDWKYLGTGIAYQLLAGPLFIVFKSISAIPMGMISELQNINRKHFLWACSVLWSLMTICGGFATAYWHVAICRLLLGIFSAACNPFSTSIIADYFPQSKRGAALGFYNWGIYVGYSLTFIMIIVEQKVGWRYVYIIAGVPGVIIGLIILLTVKEPPRGGANAAQSVDKNKVGLTGIKNTAAKLKRAFSTFADPILLLLCLAGAIRNGAGIVWAYNIRNFFAKYHPGTQVQAWMSWIPLIFGSIGAFGGGAISDKLAANRGPTGRLMVLIGCLLLSAPFQVGTILLPMPGAFIMQIPAYVIGEMWIGVCVAVVIDLVPSDLTTSAVAVYFFIIAIIGGNMNIFVTPIREGLEMRAALLITFPGMYLVAAVLFIIAFLLLKYWKRKEYKISEPETKEKELKDTMAMEAVNEKEPKVGFMPADAKR